MSNPEENNLQTVVQEMDSYLFLVAGDTAARIRRWRSLLQQQERTHPALSESQREAILIVAEVTGDLIIHAEAVESGAVSRPDHTDLLAWAEELQRPARLLETLFDLAPAEHVPTWTNNDGSPMTLVQAQSQLACAKGNLSESIVRSWERIVSDLAPKESTPDHQEGGKPDA